MLSLGWPTDEPGQEGGTALHWAAFHGNVEMVREILRHGPDLTLRDTTPHGTALDWARYGAEHGWCKDDGGYPATIADWSRRAKRSGGGPASQLAQGANLP